MWHLFARKGKTCYRITADVNTNMSNRRPPTTDLGPHSCFWLIPPTEWKYLVVCVLPRGFSIMSAIMTNAIIRWPIDVEHSCKSYFPATNDFLSVGLNKVGINRWICGGMKINKCRRFPAKYSWFFKNNIYVCKVLELEFVFKEHGAS